MTTTNIGSLFLDVYDGGPLVQAALRQVCDTPESVPGYVKCATALNDPAIRELLPDEAFALVVVDNHGEKFRKYACIDPGNTWLSAQMFLRLGGQLQEDLRQKVASNLASQLVGYGLPLPEELVKQASPNILQTAGRAAQQVSGNTHLTNISKGLSIAGNMATAKRTFDDISPSLRAVQRAGGQVRTPQELSLMKMGSDRGHFALGEKYPINDLLQVKTAEEYFATHQKFFAPADRRAYCVNLEKRASDLGVCASELVRHYAGEGYGSAEQIKVAFDGRQANLTDKVHREALEHLRAAATNQISPPEKVAEALTELDELTGLSEHWDRLIADPYASIFGVKEAAGVTMALGCAHAAESHDQQKKDEDFIEYIGSHRVHGRQLRRLSLDNPQLVAHTFGWDATSAFQKDPVSHYKSLPPHLRAVLCRMAVEHGHAKGV